MSGWILHQDNERVVIATDGSTNAKTGNMIQVWILARNQSPIDTVRDGLDSLVCGDCKHSGAFGTRTCYVRLDTAPNAVWKAYKRGNYPFLHRVNYADVFAGRAVRWGAYGDPSYIPIDILRWVSFHANNWTGYTHQWRHRPELQPYMMASVDNIQEWSDAKRAGWRTFRVRSNNSLMAHEIQCPASEEMGHKTQCERCGLCNGVRYTQDSRKDISILVHGIGKSRFIQIGA